MKAIGAFFNGLLMFYAAASFVFLLWIAFHPKPYSECRMAHDSATFCDTVPRCP